MTHFDSLAGNGDDALQKALAESAAAIQQAEDKALQDALALSARDVKMSREFGSTVGTVGTVGNADNSVHDKVAELQMSSDERLARALARSERDAERIAQEMQMEADARAAEALASEMSIAAELGGVVGDDDGGDDDGFGEVDELDSDDWGVDQEELALAPARSSENVCPYCGKECYSMDNMLQHMQNECQHVK